MSVGASTQYTDHLDISIHADGDAINVHCVLGMLTLPIDYARRMADGLTKALAEYDAAQSDSWYDIPLHLHPGGVT